MTPKGEVQALLVAGRGIAESLGPAFYGWKNSLFGFGFLC